MARLTEKQWKAKYNKGKKKPRKSSNRKFALDYFSRHEHTSTIKLCFLITELTGWKVPEKPLQYKKTLNRFKREYQNREPERRQWKGGYAHIFSPKFYSSDAWRALRYQVLENTGATCQCCGARASDGVRIHVDHIKPRSKYPELALDINNLQILCVDCNIGKDNMYDTSWREHWQQI